MEALRPTKQIVSVLRKHGRMNRRALWERLVEDQTSTSFPPASAISIYIIISPMPPPVRPKNLVLRACLELVATLYARDQHHSRNL
jgi:hypothetical protein